MNRLKSMDMSIIMIMPGLSEGSSLSVSKTQSILFFSPFKFFGNQPVKYYTLIDRKTQVESWFDDVGCQFGGYIKELSVCNRFH